MRRKFRRKIGRLILVVACLSDSTVLLNANQEVAERKRPSFERRVESRVAQFDAKGRPLIRAILDLANEYELPLGIEYIDREAVWQPLNLKLSNKSVCEILEALVAQLPQYKMRVSAGAVEIYSPKARADASNLLNTVVENFAVTDKSPRMASAAIYAAMMSEHHEMCCLAGSVLESVGEPKTTINLKNRKVYEILDALVAQNGESLWVPLVPPQRLSAPDPKLWEVYQLGWQDLVMSDLKRAFPPER
ncbi:MAG TPA: hypothetical protein VG028_07980 [Terriglobia bacterium]|nr:hypothetical protein [Terriglobia bacterium]